MSWHGTVNSRVISIKINVLIGFAKTPSLWLRIANWDFCGAPSVIGIFLRQTPDPIYRKQTVCPQSEFLLDYPMTKTTFLVTAMQYRFFGATELRFVPIFTWQCGISQGQCTPAYPIKLFRLMFNGQLVRSLCLSDLLSRSGQWWVIKMCAGSVTDIRLLRSAIAMDLESAAPFKNCQAPTCHSLNKPSRHSPSSPSSSHTTILLLE